MTFRNPRQLLWKLCSTVAFLLSAIQVAQGDVSMLTVDGEVRSMAEDLVGTQQRIGIGENGHPVVVDEYAALRIRDRRVELPFITEALGSSRAKIAALDLTSFAIPSRITGAAPPPVSADVLLIVHQGAHPQNQNFAPPPLAEFSAQAMDAQVLEGQRGFAVVDVGASGRVMRVRLLSNGKVISDRRLESAIMNGLKTTFKDERRHDHTIYMAYQIRGQTLSQIGSSVITLPQCIGICP